MNKTIFFITSFAIILLTGIVFADVTVERFTKSGGFGGVGANELTTVSKISGLKKREVGKIKMTGSLGKFVTKMAGEIETDTITDINKDVIWTLDHKRKKYTENRISGHKGMFAGDKEKAETQPGKEEKPRVKIIRNEFSVQETDDKKSINGFPCTRYLLTWLVETEDIETKERARNIMTAELWNTPESEKIKALQKEENAFNQAYMKKIGFEMSQEEMQKFGIAMMAGMLGSDENFTEANMKNLQKKLSKIKGYSIATDVKWEHFSEAKKEGVKKEEPEEEPEEEVEVSSDIGGMLGGFAKKAVKKKVKEEQKKKEAEKKAEQAKEGNVVFHSYTEIKKISLSKISGEDFEVPAGYKPSK